VGRDHTCSGKRVEKLVAGWRFASRAGRKVAGCALDMCAARICEQLATRFSIDLWTPSLLPAESPSQLLHTSFRFLESSTLVLAAWKGRLCRVPKTLLWRARLFAAGPSAACTAEEHQRRAQDGARAGVQRTLKDLEHAMPISTAFSLPRGNVAMSTVSIRPSSSE
jgi:hypothetical protein